MLRRTLKAVFWFMVGVALVALPMLTRAETVAASTSPYAGTWTYSFGTHIFSSAASGAAYFCGLYSSAVTQANETTGYVSCANSQNTTLNKALTCPSGGSGNGGTGMCTGGYSCPIGQGWTLSGSTCTRPDCPEGYDRGYDGVCIPPPDPCPAGNKSSATYFSGLYGIGGGRTSGNGLSVNIGNGGTLCDGTCSGLPDSVSGCTGQYDSGSSSSPQPIYCTTTITLTGAKCTGGNGTAPSYCPSGQSVIGSANGVPVCGKDGVPSNGSQPKVTEENKQTNNSNSTDSDGDGTPDSTSSGSESETKTTTCVGSTCTTTTTKETTNPDGSKTKEESTVTESKKSFCELNPSSEQCTDLKETAGDGAVTSDLYTKGDRTASQVFGEFGTKVRSAGFFSAASNFFTVSVPSGACTDLSTSFDVGFGQSFTVDMTSVFCGSTAQAIYSLLSAGVMLAALWVAFKIALL